MQRAKHLGFTLIELMIVVAVTGILATVAYPSYTRFVLKGNRTAAQAQMMQIANLEQSYLLVGPYVNKTVLEDRGYRFPTDLSSKYTYDITVGTDTVPSYTITFTPIGGQVSDGILTLNSAGQKTPPEKW